ncbi:MAG: hypothetical protein J7457_05920 [Roseiflexus sp.]|jgi:hypothetical protein|nr:hypothetical protein [Roseiflexus sp.]
MKVKIVRTTVVTVIGENEPKIVEAGSVVEVDKADAALLVALKRAQWVRASDAESAIAAPRGETADVRPTVRSRN